MKLRQFALALSLVGASSVGLVGCGGGSSDYPEIISLEGKAIDGYLANATVCVDENANFQCDQGEESTTTDGAGNFELLSADEDSLLVLESTENTVDLTTGQAVGEGLHLTAPFDATSITPLTTLAVSKAQVEGVSYAQAKSDIATAVGVPNGVDIDNYDYVAAQEDGSDEAASIHVLANVVAKLIQSNLNVISANSTTGNSAIRAITASYLVVAPPQGAGGTQLAQLVTDVASLGVSASDDIGTVISDNSTDIDDFIEDNTIDEGEVDTVVDAIDDTVDDGGSGGDPIDGVTGGTGGGSV